MGLALELTNTTESCITVQYERGTTRNPELCWSNAAVNQENLKMILKPGEKDKFISEKESFVDGFRLGVQLIAESIYDKSGEI